MNCEPVATTVYSFATYLLFLFEPHVRLSVPHCEVVARPEKCDGVPRCDIACKGSGTGKRPIDADNRRDRDGDKVTCAESGGGEPPSLHRIIPSATLTQNARKRKEAVIVNDPIFHRPLGQNCKFQISHPSVEGVKTMAVTTLQ